MSVLEEYLMPNYRDKKQRMTIMGDTTFNGTRYWVAVDAKDPTIVWYIWNNANNKDRSLNETRALCVTYKIDVIRKIKDNAHVYDLHRAALKMLDGWHAVPRLEELVATNINEVF